ncbi:MAG: thiolase C-terminal domain-containing protein [Nitrososphaerales archaeon]
MVTIIGVGESKFGHRLEGSAREISFEAFAEAMNDAKLLSKDIDCLLVSSSSIPGAEVEKGNAGLLATYFGTIPKPAFNVEASCASGSVGVRVAWSLIESGLHDVVAVVGYQKIGPPSSVKGGINDMMWEVPLGADHSVFFSLYSSTYMRVHGATETDLNSVTVKNRKHGSFNEKVAFKEPVTMDQIQRSPYSIPPVRKLTVADETEGSACLILCSDEKARGLTDTPISIKGIGMGAGSRSLAGRDSLMSLSALENASRDAFRMAKMERKDIDIAEVHDMCPILETLSYESSGLVAKGQAAKQVYDGQMEIGGTLPSNLDGGMQSYGHLPGVNGIQMIGGLAKQLRGDERKNIQARGAETAVAINLGGAASYATTTILAR